MQAEQVAETPRVQSSPQLDSAVIAEPPTRMALELQHTKTSSVAETKLDLPLRMAERARVARNIDAFDSALKSEATAHLQSVSRASVAIEATFDDLTSPAWDALRSSVALDQRLAAKEQALLADRRSVVSSLPSGGFVAGPAFEQAQERMAAIDDALKEVRRARFELRAATPAMAFVDSARIDLTKSNAQLAPALHAGAREVRANIADVVSRVASGDIELRQLPRLVERVLAKTQGQARADVLADIEVRKENAMLLHAGTMTASIALTLGTLGTGSLALGAIGAGFGFGTAAHDFELADDLHDVGKASLTDHDALIDAAAAHERYATATAHLVLACVDVVLTGAALRTSRLVRSFAHAPADYIPATGVRNTLGRSGIPTATPHPSQPHLGAIHKGMETMPAEVRRRLDDALAGGTAGREIRGKLNALEAETHVLMAERTSLAKRANHPGTKDRIAQIDVRAEHIHRETRELEDKLVKAQKEELPRAADVMGHFLKSIRRELDAATLAKKVQIDKRAIEQVASAQKRSLSDAESTLREWIADYLRVADPGVDPSSIRLLVDTAKDEHRSAYLYGRGIHVGSDLNKETLFHEMSHIVEFVDSSAAKSTKCWRDARARNVDPSMQTSKLDDLAPGMGYKESEIAYSKHDFYSDYIGKIYPPDSPATEVLSIAHQSLASPKTAVGLYRRDPELFYLGLGLLRR